MELEAATYEFRDGIQSAARVTAQEQPSNKGAVSVHLGLTWVITMGSGTGPQ